MHARAFLAQINDATMRIPGVKRDERERERKIDAKYYIDSGNLFR